MSDVRTPQRASGQSVIGRDKDRVLSDDKRTVLDWIADRFDEERGDAQ